MADFQSPRNPHFFKPLLPGFHFNLNIPVKFFSLYIEGKHKGKTVELRSDVSEKTWNVKMESQKLTIGWKEFAVAHDFQIGDIIVFRHEGDLVFHVTGLGLSFCEIQYVHSSDNNDDNLEDDENNIRNLSMEQELESSIDENDKNNIGKFLKKKHVKKMIPKTEAESLSSDQSCFVAHVTASNLRKDTVFLPRKFEKSHSLNKDSNKICLMNEGAGWRNFCHENGLRPGDSITFKLESNNTKTPLLRFSTSESNTVSTKHCSNQKRETVESSQRMSSSLSQNRIATINVTPASLKSGKLYLPRSFITFNEMKKVGSKKVTLMDKHGVEWPVNVDMDYRYKRLRLTAGLKKFFTAICVKADESIVLEYIHEETTTAIMIKFCSKVKTSD